MNIRENLNPSPLVLQRGADRGCVRQHLATPEMLFLLNLFVFSILLQFPASSAFDSGQIEQDGRDAYKRDLYFADLFRPYWLNRPTAFVDYQDRIIDENLEGRSRLLGRFRPSSSPRNASDDESGPSGRILNRLSSVAGNIDGNTLYSGLNLNPLSTFAPCVSSNGEEQGVCLPSPVCAFYGGRSTGGNCRLASTCCISEVTKCGSLVTINNTYWQSPTSVSSDTTCGLTVKLNPYLIEQKKKRICQIRLDFIAFSIAQPNTETICNVDNFQVAGAVNKVPVICGENDGQHMYLFVPRDATSVQLVMSFGASTVTRAWRMRVSMLPCGVDYLAPDECLQYYTAPTGTIRTFNWKDTANRAARQLANQDYYMCFRTELVRQSAVQVATTLCLSQCQTINGLAFGLSGAAAASQSTAPADCSNDYMVFPGGFSLPKGAPINQRDRFCGNVFAQGATVNAPDTICSTAKPFRVLYRTNGDEKTTLQADADPTTGNQGFCLQFEQRLS